MMKKIIILSLLVIALLFIVGCAQETVSDEDAATEAELEGLLDEDLSAELEAETSSEEGQAIAGQAYSKSKKRSSCYTKLKIASKQIKKLKGKLDDCQEEQEARP
jgi:peptidoglycan hydrolase CwlO-like protein